MTVQIAIDGPASSGKSTLAKRLSKRLGLIYLDTGAMYRSLTLAALEKNIPTEKVEELVREIQTSSLEFVQKEDGQHVIWNQKDVTKAIRSDEVSHNVSAYSAIKEVREALVDKQRQFANEANEGIVMDGRDIGTVVLPKANLKIFLEATAEERAKRRYLENKEKGLSDAPIEELIKEIKRRDDIDSNREVSPLRPAEDAIILDTSQMTIEEVEQKVLALVKK